MNRIRFFMLCCTLNLTLCAQSQIIVKGQLFNMVTKKSLPYATVSVAKEESPKNAFKKSATDQGGHFKIILPEGKYIFSFNYVGMNTMNKKIDLKKDKPSVELNKIFMSESSTELGEISVVAQKPLVKVEIDKLTYSAKDDPDARTSNVLDLLRKVPMVTVDADDKIQLKGSSNYKIYLNGKPSSMISSNPTQVLKSMRANNIKNIEVITEPGAKYDAEGVGGIINIITNKKVDEGYNGSISGGGNTENSYYASSYLTVKYGKWGASGNGSYYTYNSMRVKTSFNGKDFSHTPETLLDQHGTDKSSGSGNFMSGLVSYEPDTLNLFSFSMGGYGGNTRSLSLLDVISTGGSQYTYKRVSDNNNTYGSRDFSADYQRSFSKKDKMLTFSYKYSYVPNDSRGNTLISDLTGNPPLRSQDYKQKNKNKANGKEHTGQLDYTDPITKNQNIEAGLKYIYRDNSSFDDDHYWDPTSSQWKKDIERKNNFKHNQYIISAYGSYGYKADKFALKAGLRAEHTRQRIKFINQKESIIKTNFFNLVPSLSLSYRLSMTQTFRLGYNMRIYRPSIRSLNPYIDDSDPLNISYGNPNLKIEKNHSFSLNYGSFSQKLNINIGLKYTLTNNSITSYQFMKNGINNKTLDNIGKRQSVGISTYIQWKLLEALSFNINSELDYIDIRSRKDLSLKSNGFFAYFFGSASYSFPKDFRFSINGAYRGNNISLQTKKSSDYYLSFGVTKSFFKKNLSISLYAENPFSKYRTYVSKTIGKDFQQKRVSEYPMRSIRLSVSYNFGDLKSSVKRAQRSINNDDVKSDNNDVKSDNNGSQNTIGR